MYACMSIYLYIRCCIYVCLKCITSYGSSILGASTYIVSVQDTLMFIVLPHSLAVGSVVIYMFIEYCINVKYTSLLHTMRTDDECLVLPNDGMIDKEMTSVGFEPTPIKNTT